LIAGSADLMLAARRVKHRFGGAMRQAGIVAAAGLFALDHNVERLADDHARARRLAEAWFAQGVPIELERVQSNFVQIDVQALGLGEWEAVDALGERGVGLSRTMRPGVLRAVTHLDLTDHDIERALELVPEVLGARVRV
jgi:threonine aldolase